METFIVLGVFGLAVALTGFIMEGKPNKPIVQKEA